MTSCPFSGLPRVGARSPDGGLELSSLLYSPIPQPARPLGAQQRDRQASATRPTAGQPSRPSRTAAHTRIPSSAPATTASAQCRSHSATPSTDPVA